MQQWYVYLLSCADASLYCGITTDLQRRVQEHNGEKAGGAKYTRGRRPVYLCAYACCADRKSALQTEAFIRTVPKKKKIATLEALQVAYCAEEKS